MSSLTSPLFLRDDALEQALELLLLAERGLAAESAGARARAGLAEHDLDLLWLIHRRPGATLAELASLLGTAKQSTSRHLQALEAAGLVTRERDRGDRRRRPLRLTERGRALVNAIGERRKLGLRRAFQSAGAEAVAGFQRVLGELAEAATRRPGGRPTG
ncbi:MAG: helix-turn-helix domain-containing protein [Geminicoccaceae bacterium]|nr:helix-turn-helix domain-containing protein [Geminicoccaceae bacterium]MDW8368881.1 MarR family transcriptional regulator [Geminicoccaceae bacterium]